MDFDKRERERQVRDGSLLVGESYLFFIIIISFFIQSYLLYPGARFLLKKNLL